MKKTVIRAGLSAVILAGAALGIVAANSKQDWQVTGHREEDELGLAGKADSTGTIIPESGIMDFSYTGYRDRNTYDVNVSGLDEIIVKAALREDTLSMPLQLEGVAQAVKGSEGESDEDADYTAGVEEADKSAGELTSREIQNADDLNSASEQKHETDANVEDIDGIEEAEEENWEKRVVAQVDGSLRVREEADAQSAVVGKLSANAVALVLEEGSEWTKIESGNVTGYVSNDYLLIGDAADEYIAEHYKYCARVTTTSLNVRAEAGTDSESLGKVRAGQELEVVSESDEWIEIQYKEDLTAFVSSDYVTVGWNYPVAMTLEEEQAMLAAEQAAREAQVAAVASDAGMGVPASGVSEPSAVAVEPPAPSTSAEGLALGQQIANYACQFVGNPYRYGGTSLTNGTDCSGFTMSVYAQFGYSLPHASSSQKACGISVPLDQVQPGDIICYSGHVGMYIGNGQIVHAGDERTGIYITSMYYDSPYDARRIVN